MRRLNDSVIVVRLKPDEYSLKLKGSVIALICKKRLTADANHFAILTVLCNSTSMIFLFATTGLYIVMKSLRMKVACAIPHLATSLFLAQFFFQVSSIFMKSECLSKSN